MGYMGMGHMGNGGTGVWITWAMGYRGNWVQRLGAHGQWDTGSIGPIDNGTNGQWGTGVWITWAMGYTGMGHMGNRAQWAIGYKGLGHMDNGVQAK